MYEEFQDEAVGNPNLCSALGIVQCSIKTYITARPPPGGSQIREVVRCQTFKSLVKSFSEQATASTQLSTLFGEVNKGLQAIAAEFTAYSKKTLADGTRAFEQLLSAKSFEQVIEIQSQYARMVYEAHIAELSKLGEMYAGLTRKAYKPVEQAAAKAGSPNRLRSA